MQGNLGEGVALWRADAVQGWGYHEDFYMRATLPGESCIAVNRRSSGMTTSQGVCGAIIPPKSLVFTEEAHGPPNEDSQGVP